MQTFARFLETVKPLSAETVQLSWLLPVCKHTFTSQIAKHVSTSLSMYQSPLVSSSGSCSIHPSGRMALSVSRDRTMRLWNLLEGRCAYIKRLQGEGELVRWSHDGDSYLVVVGNTVVSYSAATAEAVGECQHQARVNSACFVASRGAGAEGSVAIATCADDKTIRFFRAAGGMLLVRVRLAERVGREGGWGETQGLKSCHAALF